ncbi:short-chain collagen C4-like [Littorina saxatilis]|uniref:Short-chain collagen C4-like n=1 Tax=Littorina saxatilis TaxID=31220 RepID=A0AAN9BVK7_9CAEN
MRAMLLLPGLMILVALVTEGWAGLPPPPPDDSATDADILAELVKVKKIQRNMKRLFTGQIEDLEKQVKSLEDNETDSLQAMQSQFQTLISQFESKIASVAASGSGSGGGSSYVRWGRKTCPDGASQVYAGVVGGKHYAHAGGATNALCLTKEPEYDNTTKPVYYGYLYGAEYEYIGDNHDHDVPCSVCVAPKATTIMVPARITCPEGWTAQYSGHLVSEYYGRAATEYLCLDGSPEVEVGGEPNKNGFLLYLVLTKCGSLPCPPYKDNLVTTCVVCSK